MWLCVCLTCVSLIIAEHGVAFDFQGYFDSSQAGKSLSDDCGKIRGDRVEGKSPAARRSEEAQLQPQPLCENTVAGRTFFPFFVLKKGGKLTLQNFERLSLRSVRFCLTLTKEACFLFSYRHLRRLFLLPTLLQFKPNHECSRLIRVFASLSTAIHLSTAEVHKALQRKELRDTEENAALD